MSNLAQKGMAASTGGELRYFIDAADSAGIIGYSSGAIGSAFGGIRPDDDYQEYNIAQLFNLAAGSLVMRFPQINVPNEDHVFFRLTLTGVFLDTGLQTLEYFRDDADYADPGTNQTGWTWTADLVDDVMIDGESYRLKLFTEPETPPDGVFRAEFAPEQKVVIHRMSAGALESGNGYSSLAGSAFGNLQPRETETGLTIRTTADFASVDRFVLVILGPNQPDNDTTFVSVSFTGDFRGGVNPRTQTYIRSERDIYDPFFDGASPSTRWDWNMFTAIDGLVGGNEYEVRFVFQSGQTLVGYSEVIGSEDDPGGSIIAPFGRLSPNLWAHPTLGNLEITRFFNDENPDEFILGFNIAGGIDLPDEDDTWGQLKITGPFDFEYITGRTVGFRSTPRGSFYGWVLPEAVDLSPTFEYDVEITAGSVGGAIWDDDFISASDVLIENYVNASGGGYDFSHLSHVIEVFGGLGYLGKSDAGVLGGNTIFVATLDESYQDIIIRIQISYEGSRAYIGPIFRYSGTPPGSYPNGTFYVIRYDNDDNILQLIAVIDGSSNILETIDFTLLSDTIYEIEVTVVGRGPTLIDVKIDGQTVMNYSDFVFDLESGGFGGFINTSNEKYHKLTVELI